MKNIWETCTFSDEIVTGDVDVSKFAVELHDILDGTADNSYLDPKTFLENTFLTDSMKVILKDSILRLTNGKGQPVHVMDTGFGGGKTHTLILLHHVFKNKDLGTEYISKYNFETEYSINKIPSAHMVTIDCRRIKKNTVWGELGEVIGKYDLIKKYDQSKRPPDDIGIIKSLFDKPTLVLIDELPHYLLNADAEKINNVSLSDLTIKFLMDLISAISSTKNSRLILTLPGKNQLYEKYTEKIKRSTKSLKDYDADRIVETLKTSLARQVQFIVPVDKHHIYDVVRTRLVKKIDQNEKRKTVDEYADYFEKYDLLEEHDYRNKLSSAYPIHPFLIDTLFLRVSTIDQFNNARGILRLIGLMLSDIYKSKKECFLVGTSDIDLTDREIEEELTVKLDRGDFRAVIESDCIRKAQSLDENKNIKLNEPMARTIYLYSLIGSSTKSGIRPSSIKLSVCKPSVDPSLVDKYLETIEKEFWYLKYEGGEYYFDKEPNINKIISEYQKEVKSHETKDKILQSLSNLLPSKENISTIIWNEEQLEDNDKIKIFVIPYEKNIEDDESARGLISNYLESNANGSIRKYQNTIVFLYADKNGIGSLEEKARRLVAIEKARNDERIQLNKENLKKITTRQEEAKSEIKSECISVYSKLGYPDKSSPRLDQISALDSKSTLLTDMIIELLVKKGKLISNLSVDGLPEISDITPLKEIYDKFKSDKSKKFIVSGRSILEAVTDGIMNGKFGYSSDIIQKDGKYQAKINCHCQLSWDGYLFAPNLVYQEKKKSPQPEKQPEEEQERQHAYRIECQDLGQIIEILDKLQILQLEYNFTKSLHATLESEDINLTLESSVKNSAEVKSFLQSQKTRFSGRGYLTIRSDSDLQNDFNKYSITAINIA